MERRRFLGLAGGAGLALTGAKTVDNVFLGYGTLTGTNLLEQDLRPKLDERLGPDPGRSIAVDGTDVIVEDDGLDVDGETLPWAADDDQVERVERDHGLPDGSIAQLVADVPAFWAGEYAIEADTLGSFFERAAEADHGTHPYTVAALRGPSIRSVDPALVAEFADVDPTDPEAIAYGFVDAFRETTFYDAPRYVAGAIEDNVLRRRVDLRRPFESPSDFQTLLEGENRGTFCYDYVYRSVEAFHAVPAADQTVPVFGAYVRNSRHKHAYTGLATVVAGDDGPTLLVTFLDYTGTTAAHSFGLTRAVGDDPNAYDSSHRTTDVYWDRRAPS